MGRIQGGGAVGIRRAGLDRAVDTADQGNLAGEGQGAAEPVQRVEGDGGDDGGAETAIGADRAAREGHGDAGGGLCVGRFAGQQCAAWCDLQILQARQGGADEAWLCALTNSAVRVDHTDREEGRIIAETGVQPGGHAEMGWVARLGRGQGAHDPVGAAERGLRGFHHASDQDGGFLLRRGDGITVLLTEVGIEQVPDQGDRGDDEKQVPDTGPAEQKSGVGLGMVAHAAGFQTWEACFINRRARGDCKIP